MAKRLWRIALAAICAAGLLSSAPVSAARLHDDAPWRAEYFNNMTLSGTPVLVRDEAKIDYDWGLHSPAPSVRADGFSARWTRTVNFEYTGNYRFYMTSDDGMRIWVDGILLIDQWFDRQDAWMTGNLYLTAGTHILKVEYYENVGAATARVVYQPEGVATGGAWLAEYWVTPDLDSEEEPADRTNTVPDIDFDWGRGSPADWIPASWFSARFTRDLVFTGGTYQFVVTTEGGVRLYVDDALIVDEWHETDKTTYRASRTLSAAVHRVKLEYMDTYRDAGVTLRWQPAVMSVTGWKGEYFGTEDPNTTPVMVRDDKAVDFNWGNNPPGVGMSNEHWSARWTRTLNFVAGYYRFTTVTDDGVRLWVDGTQIIDRWEPNNSKPFFGDIYLTAGSHQVKMEYYNLTGGAEAHLTWVKTDTTSTSALVDDGGIGFTSGGAATGWRTSYYGYGGRSRSMNNVAGFWARWMPPLPRLGRYEVLVYVPSGTNRTAAAHYYLKHEGDVVDIQVNQRAKAGQWVSLGIYTFNADGSEFLHLDGVTNETAGTRTLGVDAVRFVYRAP